MTAFDDSAVGQVERRLEVRRGRFGRHVEELEQAARDRTRPLAFIGLAAFALVGFAVARATLARPAPRHPPRATAARAGILAGLVTAVQIALQIAGNPLVRRGYEAFRRSRSRR